MPSTPYTDCSAIPSKLDGNTVEMIRFAIPDKIQNKNVSYKSELAKVDF